MMQSMEPDETAADFVRANTRLGVAPLLPEVRLHIAEDVFGLWERTETERGRPGLAPPFWGFAWAGGQALARHVLDHPGAVADRHVLDLASGCGLVAIAAARSGAAAVRAVDVDPLAIAAIGLNARANDVVVDAALVDVLDTEGDDIEVVLAGDVFYDRDMAARVLPYLERVLHHGADVLVGDPGRAHLPRERVEPLASYDVPVPHDLEGMNVRTTTVWRLSRR